MSTGKKSQAAASVPPPEKKEVSLIDDFRDLIATVDYKVKPEDLHWGDYISKFDAVALLELARNTDIIREGGKILGLGMAGRLTAKKIANSKLKNWKITLNNVEMGPSEFARFILTKGTNLAGLTQVIICASKLHEDVNFKLEHPNIAHEDSGTLFPLEKSQLIENIVMRFHKARTIRGYNPPTLQVCLDQVNFSRALLKMPKLSVLGSDIDEAYFQKHGVQDISSKLNQGLVRHEDLTKSDQDNASARKRNIDMREELDKGVARKV